MREGKARRTWKRFLEEEARRRGKENDGEAQAQASNSKIGRTLLLVTAFTDTAR
jgi:hypothetical protein